MRLRELIVMMVTALAVLVVPLADAGTLQSELQLLQREWALIHYQARESEREPALEILSQRAHALSEQYPGHAEPRVWEGIILSTYAGAKGGLEALELVKNARDRLLEAEQIDPNALDGSIYTSLGSLYYQVPGWPIGFGDDQKAEQYLQRALQLNPDGIDPNYFYGDFLIEQGRYQQALEVLRRALKAAPRQGRQLADAGRRDEIYARIYLAEERLSDSSKPISLW
jgi:tetratricopeptide (TPR) repeat protein